MGLQQLMLVLRTTQKTPATYTASELKFLTVYHILYKEYGKYNGF